MTEPQIQQKGLKLSNTHSPISIQKHDSARSCSFRKKNGICSLEVSHCFQSAANMLPLLSPVFPTGIRPSGYIAPTFNTSTVVLGIKHSDFTFAFPSPTLCPSSSLFHSSPLSQSSSLLHYSLFFPIPCLWWVDFFWQGSQIRVV